MVWNPINPLFMYVDGCTCRSCRESMAAERAFYRQREQEQEQESEPTGESGDDHAADPTDVTLDSF